MVSANGVVISHKTHRSIEAKCGVMVKGPASGTVSRPQRDVLVKLL